MPDYKVGADELTLQENNTYVWWAFELSYNRVKNLKNKYLASGGMKRKEEVGGALYFTLYCKWLDIGLLIFIAIIDVWHL